MLLPFETWSICSLLFFQIFVYPTAAILVFLTASCTLPLGTGLSLGISTLSCQVISHTPFVPALIGYFIRYSNHIGALYMQHIWKNIAQKPHCCQSHLHPVYQCSGTITVLLLTRYYFSAEMVHHHFSNDCQLSESVILS